MFRGKSWFSGGVLKPRNPHSLDHLKFLYQILSKNQVVTEQNKSLLVETLRSIAEILIWGDQNDSTVFDFFLEKNMLSFFLKIMRQKCGSYVCVQLLQTLNILFENIRNETSLYYLLSNNHVNSIIVHKFDFSDEEVMAYYISFLKTLSLKLNNHTIHFFYNEHTNDFPLYTEGIKFFNHSESMVRIAVRTLTLNVFRVEDKAMLKFIRDRTAAPYFSNLVYFIGKHVLELDGCVRQAVATSGGSRLADLVAEHLDHLHYLHDILTLNIAALNAVLSDHLLNRLLIPLYVYSLIAPATPSNGCSAQPKVPPSPNKRPHVSRVVALFLLSQVFLIISHQPLVRHLAQIILNRDVSVFGHHHDSSSSANSNGEGSEPGFVAPEEPLEKSLESSRSSPAKSQSLQEDEDLCKDEATQVNNIEPTLEGGEDALIPPEGTNITDEEKAEAAQRMSQTTIEQIHHNFSLSERPFLDAIFQALDCTENDRSALFSLCLLYALGHNSGINQDLLDSVLLPSEKSEAKTWYNITLAEHLIKIINLSCQYNSRVRLATLQMTLTVLEQLVIKEGRSFLQDSHFAAIEQSREEATLLLRNFYKSEEIFLDMFEDEYQEIKKKPLNVEYLTMDASLLLPPAGTPMSGVEFHKRLPCGEVERAKRTIRVFFLLRNLSLKLQGETESQLPLTNLADCIKVDDVLDLNNSDLIACTVVSKDGHKTRRFMVIDKLQLVLVEPDTKRLGWGVAKFVGFLQDIEVMGDKDDSRCLHLTVHRPAVGGGPSGRRSPLLAARFLFDDHIRCLAAKQRLTKGRLKARQTKMHRIARLLDLPEHIQPCPSPLRQSLHNTPVSATRNDHSGGMHRSLSQDTGLRGRTSAGAPRLLSSGAKVPGFAAKLKPSPTLVPHQPELTECPSGSRSREASPHPAGSEEIPLEDLSRTPRSVTSGSSSSYLRRKSSSGLPRARISAPPSLTTHYSSSPSTSVHQRSCPIHTEEALSSSVPIPLSQSTPRCLVGAPNAGHSPESPPCSKPCCVLETTREVAGDSPDVAPSASNAPAPPSHHVAVPPSEPPPPTPKGSIQTV